MTPHLNSTGFSPPPHPRGAAAFPIWQQLLPRHLLQGSRQLFHGGAGRANCCSQHREPGCSCGTGWQRARSCWGSNTARPLPPRQAAGGSCRTGAGSKWYLAARQDVSHLWHHSPSRQGKMWQAKYPKGHIWPNSSSWIWRA